MRASLCARWIGSHLYTLHIPALKARGMLLVRRARDSLQDADADGCVGPVQAVIFLFEHSESGSAGLILNRRTSYNIGSLTGADMLCPEFAGVHHCPMQDAV